MSVIALITHENQIERHGQLMTDLDAALDSFFTQGLHPYLLGFRDRYPDIELTLVGASGYSDLARKEAFEGLRGESTE